MWRQIIGGASGGQVRSFEAEKQDREGEHSVGRQERGGRGVTEFGGLRQSSKLNRGRFPRVFGDEFGEEFGDKFGDDFSESLNLVMNLVENLATNLVIHQNW